MLPLRALKTVTVCLTNTQLYIKDYNTIYLSTHEINALFFKNNIQIAILSEKCDQSFKLLRILFFLIFGICRCGLGSKLLYKQFTLLVFNKNREFQFIFFVSREKM